MPSQPDLHHPSSTGPEHWKRHDEPPLTPCRWRHWHGARHPFPPRVAAAEPQIRTGAFDDIAVQEYDPVACFKAGKPVKGTKEFPTTWNGAEFRFASGDAFEEYPEAYAPQYGGYCAGAVSQGYTAKGDAKFWKIVDGKLYLNYNSSVQKSGKATSLASSPPRTPTGPRSSTRFSLIWLVRCWRVSLRRRFSLECGLGRPVGRRAGHRKHSEEGCDQRGARLARAGTEKARELCRGTSSLPANSLISKKKKGELALALLYSEVVRRLTSFWLWRPVFWPGQL